MPLKDIDFGFAEPIESVWKLTSKYFPSKVGGRPAFLVLDPVLGAEQLTCNKCGEIMRFILQIYAPVDNQPSAFHRTLFVFACGRTAECANEIICFRSQLSKQNRFYRETPPDYDAPESENDDELSPLKFGVKLCPVCGIEATKKCGQCLSMNYCCRGHQIIHWKTGGHKQICDKLKYSKTVEVADHSDAYEQYTNAGILCPEFSIEMDPGSDEDEYSEDEDDSKKLENYEKLLKLKKPEFQNENLDDAESEIDEETKIFTRFAKQSSLGEIIRYRKDWERLTEEEELEDILWISSNKPDLATHIPKCNKCGARRSFEFQIMPQLLKKILPNRSLEDQLDWGTVIVFSCTQSCQPNDSIDSYQPEFVFVQNVG